MNVTLPVVWLRWGSSGWQRATDPDCLVDPTLTVLGMRFACRMAQVNIQWLVEGH